VSCGARRHRVVGGQGALAFAQILVCAGKNDFDASDPAVDDIR
jgi:hypothetical protein